MTAASIRITFEKDTTCSICLQTFQDPVILPCGHSFCRACITSCKETDFTVLCPVCRIDYFQKDLIPNRHLDNIVQNYKELQSKILQNKKPGTQQKKDLSLSCENDAHQFSTACKKYKAHQSYSINCTKNAAKGYKNMRSTLIRWKRKTPLFPTLLGFSDIKEKLGSQAKRHALKKRRATLLNPGWTKENVLLDPETAHPRYIVSQDRKSISWAEIRQIFPDCPKRFEKVRCVLGNVGFTSGKHYWMVAMGNGGCWAVGVAKESVERKYNIVLKPGEGIWALGLFCYQYKALTSPLTPLNIDQIAIEPAEIQVSLDYDAGTVAFYDVKDQSCFYKFQSVDFAGERVFPFFRIADPSTCLQLSS